MDCIYFDFNATSPLDKRVYSTICNSLKEHWGNPSSNSFYGSEAKNVINLSRKKISTLLHCNPDGVTFTSGGTEANNMVIRSAISSFKSPNNLKPHIVTSSVEHDATIKLLNVLEEEGIIEVTQISPSSDGTLHPQSVLGEVKHNTCLITLMMANNETGVIFNIKEIGSLLLILNRERQNKSLNPVLFHIDAAQTIGKIPVDISDLNVDYISVVGHKFYGPRIGAVCRIESAPLKPIFYGGGQESGLRPGTENTPLIAGLGEACEIVHYNLEKFSLQMSEIRDYFELKLKEKFQKHVIINFDQVPRLPNTTSASFVGVTGSKLLSACPKVIASTGAACHSSSTKVSRILIQLLPTDVAEGTIRFSFGRESTKGEVNTAVDLLYNAYKKIKC